MFKTLTATTTIFLAITTPILAQNYNQYSDNFSLSPQFDGPEITEYEKVIINSENTNLRLRIEVENGSYQVGGNRYRSSEKAHIVLPPNSSTTLTIGTVGARGFHERIDVKIIEY